MFERRRRQLLFFTSEPDTPPPKGRSLFGLTGSRRHLLGQPAPSPHKVAKHMFGCERNLHFLNLATRQHAIVSDPQANHFWSSFRSNLPALIFFRLTPAELCAYILIFHTLVGLLVPFVLPWCKSKKTNQKLSEKSFKLSILYTKVFLASPINWDSCSIIFHFRLFSRAFIFYSLLEICDCVIFLLCIYFIPSICSFLSDLGFFALLFLAKNQPVWDLICSRTKRTTKHSFSPSFAFPYLFACFFCKNNSIQTLEKPVD